jgi:TetR/AcrR family transcriptional regulator, transcriptional repressor for nem operon
MRYAIDHKDKSRQKILSSASRLIRSHGIGRVSVAAAMNDAGLTHGAFYAHFNSKDELIAESIRHSMNETIGHLRDVASSAKAGTEFKAVVQSYLSEEHLSKPWLGCAVAHLCQEAARSSPAIRAAMTDRIATMISFISEFMPQKKPQARSTAAQGAYSAMVGALNLARAVEDPEEGRRILNAAKATVLGLSCPEN